MTPKRKAEEEEVAQAYAIAIRKPHLIDNDWSTFNREIIDRWSLSALVRVKTRAWQILEAAR